jgi:Domain of unkown function (DUF1775)
MKRNIITCMVVLGVAALAVPTAFGHAVVSPIQPQGAALAGARTSYVLRVPNERSNRATTKITMQVPGPIQTAISVLKMPGWSIKLTRVDTGQKAADGSPVLATTAITWTPLKGEEVLPGFYAEVFFRFQNPIVPQSLCFSVLQQYGGKLNAKGVALGAGELVSWTGGPETATPASCVNIVAGP